MNILHRRLASAPSGLKCWAVPCSPICHTTLAAPVQHAQGIQCAAAAFPTTLQQRWQLQQVVDKHGLQRFCAAAAAAAEAAAQGGGSTGSSSTASAALQQAGDNAGSVASSQQELPSLLDLLSTHGARLTTAAQLLWAQMLQPGDVAVDATCGNGNDTLFMAQRVGPTGMVHGIDLQASAIEATRQHLQQHLPAAAMPQLQLTQGCHSQLQQLVGSNVAKLVAFNLGYLPGGDKAIITKAGSTLAAVEAALEVVCPGGLISIMAYIGHPGGLEEYEQVRELLAGLNPNYWTSSELKLLNRPTAPVLLLLWRRPETLPDKGRRQ